MNKNDGGISYEEYRSQCFALERNMEEIREKLLKLCGKQVVVYKNNPGFAMILRGELSYTGKNCWEVKFTPTLKCSFILEEAVKVTDSDIYLR